MLLELRIFLGTNLVSGLLSVIITYITMSPLGNNW